jgi:predicted AAA+ superfamily ATPase
VREGVRFERGTVVTENVERDERVEGVKVRFVPLWKWLLERGQKWTGM